MQGNDRFSLSAILQCFEQQTAQYPLSVVAFVLSAFLGRFACIMFTMESTIIDIAIGTEETDLLNASD